MRKWVIAGVLLLSAVAIAALALVNLNSSIARNRGYFLEQARRALGRKVSVGAVEVTLWSGVGLRLRNVALGDDPSFSSGDFIRAGDLQVNVKLLPLLRKELQIKRLILHDPVIEVVRDKAGRFNFSSIGTGEKETDDEKGKAPQIKSERGAGGEKRVVFPSIALGDISRGELHYRDLKEGIDLRLQAIDFQVKEMGPGKPFSADFAAALLSEKQNLKFKADIGPLSPEGDFGSAPLQATIEIDPLDLGRLRAAVPWVDRSFSRDFHPAGLLRVKDLQVKGTFQRAVLKETTLSLGNSRMRLAAQLDRLSPLALSYRLSAQELRPSDFQASLSEERKGDVIKNLSSEGSFAAKEGKLAFQGKVASGQGTLYRIEYKDLAATLLSEGQTTSIRNLRVSALNGSLQAEGQYSSDGPAPRFFLAAKFQGLDLKALYRALDPMAPRDIQGRLNADLKISGTGKGWKEIKPTLRGQGEAEVLEGALLNFNLAEGVASSVTGIPGLASWISPQVRQKYPATFEAKDTVFKELNGIFDLEDGRIKVKTLRITAVDYAVQGTGWVDFDRRIDFRSSLLFSPPLSADLSRAVREAKYLFNEQNQFEMPFTLSGTLPKVKPRPDAQYLSRLIQRGMARKGVEELKKRFFGSKGANPSEEAPAEGQKKRDKPTREELIRKGIEGLFGR